MSLAANLIFVLLVAVCIYNKCLYLNQKDINKIYETQLKEQRALYEDLLNIHRNNLYNTSGAMKTCAEVVKYYKLLEEVRKDKEKKEEVDNACETKETPKEESN